MQEWEYNKTEQKKQNKRICKELKMIETGYDDHKKFIKFKIRFRI